MNTVHFRIFVERLRYGKEELFDFEADPDFLEISEKEVVFKDRVHVVGKAYLAQDDLVIQAFAVTSVWIPCQICNEWTQVVLEVPQILGLFPQEEFKSAVFDMAPLIREEILLEVPQFVECQLGRCPQREQFAPFLKKEEDKESYNPFKELI